MQRQQHKGSLVQMYSAILAKFGGVMGTPITRDARNPKRANYNNEDATGMSLKPRTAFYFKRVKGARSASQRSRANRRKS